ncbi:heme-degrading monooxygenase HmoA [Paenibacillus rhizosphaerae]|uniref:Heme-degrading monooxygenase HmoA n=1 Tax=Paenibacillus rhizosphaerae TaxID=297318 RepID=A0A839TSV1_9BACL|nr:antibiotic biosynthesis monooxygenase [Paenibacillus rhizosphaerae]MBB3129906.1 heme-degrading monooxygenase HmoA [Paenibacillus rhizosphaerae]
MGGSNNASQPVIWVNTFKVKPGKLDEFIRVQTEELHSFAERDSVKGVLGSRFLRASHRDRAIAVTLFESVESHQTWLKQADFSTHYDKVKDLIEVAEGDYFTVEAAFGATIE